MKVDFKENKIKSNKEKILNKKTKYNQNGITLIALVITIIVLLILAGVSIAMLTGQNGILTQAQNAKNRTEEAKEEEQNRLDEYENKINEYANGVNSGGSGETTNTPKVPNGFHHVEGTEVESGFVISSEEGDDLNNSKGGNQYVWIPVDGILGENNKTVQNAVDGEIILGRYVFNSEGKIDTENAVIPETLGGELKTDRGSSYSYTESSTGKGNTPAKDIQGFINSVRTNGGYYIARFEASEGQNGKAESKYNKAVFNDVTQSEAFTACQNLYAGINSDLVNSYAWDTALLFIQKYGQNNYSREIGQSTTSQIANTGKNLLKSTNKEDVQLNIYDMAGNCYEWTTETYSNASAPCVYRGGNYGDSNNSAFYRNSLSTSLSSSNLSFRPLLYI